MQEYGPMEALLCGQYFVATISPKRRDTGVIVFSPPFPLKRPSSDSHKFYNWLTIDVAYNP